MAIRAYMNIVFAKSGGIGPARAALLQAIAKYGSIGAAAEAVGGNYRRTARNVRLINEQFGEIIVTKRGRDGGAQLTPKGEKLLKRYQKIQQGFYDVFAKDLRYLERLCGEDPKEQVEISRNEQVLEPRRSRPSESQQSPKA
jgi:molybdate transport system regulatory protein